MEWIHYGSTGVNVEVLKLAKTKKILITNTRRMFDNAVAATVMSFIFTLARRDKIIVSILKVKKDLIENSIIKLLQI